MKGYTMIKNTSREGRKFKSASWLLAMNSITDENSTFPSSSLRSQSAFTLAEVLITLVVIGIVSAITIPSLKQSTEDKQYKAAREKALLTIGQAGRQMAVNGTLIQTNETAETFVKKYFSKYVKIAKMCGSGQANLEECGLSKEITRLSDDEKINMPIKIRDLSNVADFYGVSAALNMPNFAFTLTNGYAVNLFYNPYCTSDIKNSNSKALSYICINAIYDMNGLKKPNKVGKDIGFISVLYPDTESIAVAPDVYKENVSGSKTFEQAVEACSEIDKNLVLPSKDELLAMNYNNILLDLPTNLPGYWASSNSLIDNSSAWMQEFQPNGGRYLNDKNRQYNVRCVWK